MFIHIGNGNVIQTDDIITIIDQDIISSSVAMEEMMKNVKIIGANEETKSLVITEDVTYFSTLSVATLKKRASMISTISKLDDYTDGLELDN